MKNILVVGGGIVGITAAYFAKQKGSRVTLVESDERLGGLLKSKCNEYGCFDYGTHVAHKVGIKELDDFLYSDFNADNSYEFNTAKSGNFFEGKLSNTSPFVNTNHLPKDVYEKGRIELLNSSNEIGNNLKETLINRYGHTFYKVIFEKVVRKIFGCDAQELANECLSFFDMNRLLIFDKETTILKKKDKTLDEKIGFHSETQGANKIYPKIGGIGAWVKYLEQKLVNLNIDIKKQTTVTGITIENNKFSVALDKEVIEVDELVWTLYSGLLNRFISTGIAGKRPNFRKTAIYDFVFDSPLETLSIYINIYDKAFLSNRITNYQNLQKKQAFYACSVEVLNENNFNFEGAIDDIKQELFKIGLIGKNHQCLFSQCRALKEGFPVLTNENVNILKDINKYYEKKHKNITLLGRSSAKGFFMSELLTSAYQEMKK